MQARARERLRQKKHGGRHQPSTEVFLAWSRKSLSEEPLLPSERMGFDACKCFMSLSPCLRRIRV